MWPEFLFFQLLMIWYYATQCACPMPVCAEMGMSLNQGPFNYFQVFSVSSFAMPSFKVQFKNHLYQLISIESNFSPISPEILAACLMCYPGNGFSHKLSILCLPSLHCCCDLEVGEKNGRRMQGRRVMFWLESKVSFCAFYVLCPTIRHSSESSCSRVTTILPILACPIPHRQYNAGTIWGNHACHWPTDLARCTNKIALITSIIIIYYGNSILNITWYLTI